MQLPQILILPFLEKKWSVANVDYRLAGGADVSLEDCVADCNDAVNWVFQNAGQYRFDTQKIYLSGESAGGHLSLLTVLKFRFSGHQHSR